LLIKVSCAFIVCAADVQDSGPPPAQPEVCMSDHLIF